MALLSVWTSNTKILYTSLIKRMENIISGEKDLTGRINIISVDEISTLSTQINHFCHILAKSFSEIKSKFVEFNSNQQTLLETLNISIFDMFQIDEKIKSSISFFDKQNITIQKTTKEGKEVVTNVNEVFSKIANLIEKIEISTNDVEKMVVAINDITQSTNLVNIGIVELTKLISQGEENINNTIESINSYHNYLIIYLK